MKKYQTLIFDLDDTLIDNRQAIRYAFFSVLNKLGIKNTEELFEKWLEFEGAYWHSWETGGMIIPSNVKTKEDTVTYLRAN